MKKIFYVLFAILVTISSCSSKKDEYDPYKISTKEKKVESKSSFEVSFKETDSNVKTIHVKLNNNGYDVLFDTGCSGVLISKLELVDLMKSGTLSETDRVGYVTSSIADGSLIRNPVYNIKKVTIVDNKGKEHTLTDIQATVVENASADILIGTSVIDNLAKKSYTVDLRKKVIIFQ